MNGRIKDKIAEIEQYLSELSYVLPQTFKEYQKDFIKKAACERYAEKIIAAIVDLAFLIIKYKKMQIPENEIEAFDILAKENIIPGDLADRLQDAKRMRNIIAHEYGEVDDKTVFYALREELEQDSKAFIKAVGSNLL